MKQTFSAIAIAMNYLEGAVNMRKSNIVENCTHIEFRSKEVQAPFGLCKIPV